MCFSQSDSWFKEGVAQSKNSTFPGRSCKAYYDLSTEAQNIPSTTFSRKSKSLRLVQIQGARNETLSCMWEWQDHVAEAHRALVLPPSQFSSVQSSSAAQSCPILWPHGLQHARLPCPSPTPGVYSNSHPSSQWYHPSISPSVVPFSSRLQSFPASGSFPVSQFFAWGGQSIGVSASAWTGWISLQSKVTISGKYDWPRLVTWAFPF